jgi:hypothetical protein
MRGIDRQQLTWPFERKDLAMLDIEGCKRDINGDPAPTFATDAEIQFAERLRRQLEERYLAPEAVNAPLPAGSREGR